MLFGGLKTGVKSAYLLADESKKKLNVRRLDSSDVSIDVPSVVPPDGSDAVVVLELNGQVERAGFRLLSPQHTNRFLAFDANLHGQGFGFGDGKTDRYFVDGWKTATQFLFWDFKVIQASEYRVVVRYFSGPSAGGRYLLQQGDFKKELPVVTQKTSVVTQEVGTINLNKGAVQLRISCSQCYSF